MCVYVCVCVCRCACVCKCDDIIQMLQPIFVAFSYIQNIRHKLSKFIKVFIIYGIGVLFITLDSKVHLMEKLLVTTLER